MNGVKSFLLFLFGTCALWDVATTVFGTFALIDANSLASIAGSIAVGIFILAMLSLTMWIFEQPSDIIITFFKVLWFLALGYDLYTSWNGNLSLLFNAQGSGALMLATSVNSAQFVIAIGLTMFMSFSPIAWIYVYKKY